MRALPFRDAFDVALILDAFGYFDAAGEDLRFLSGLRDVLRPDGRFVMRNPNGALIRRQFRPADEEVRDGATTSVRSDLSRDGWWLHQDVTIQQLGSTHSYVRHQRIYAAEELDELMRATRFSVLGHYADASGMPFDSLISTHLVTVCATR
jgi:SAM-dependent methyltransferase